MMRGRNGWVVVLTAAWGIGLAYFGGSRASAADPQASGSTTRAEDEKAIRDSAGAYSKAFAARDAKALAALWTEDGDFTDETGAHFEGRAALEREFAARFTGQPSLTFEVEIESIRFLGNDVAIESGIARAKAPSGAHDSASRYRAVHVRQGGKWLMASVSESAYTPSSSYERLKQLEWLIGDWKADGPGGSLEMTCAWAPRKNFLTRTYKVTPKEGEANWGIQMIGWDPRNGQVRAWQFDCDGGFGSSVWTQEGPRWLLHSTGTLPDGSETESTNVLTKADDNCFTWASTGRTVDGDHLPDLPAVKVCRVNAKE